MPQHEKIQTPDGSDCVELWRGSAERCILYVLLYVLCAVRMSVAQTLRENHTLPVLKFDKKSNKSGHILISHGVSGRGHGSIFLGEATLSTWEKPLHSPGRSHTIYMGEATSRSEV
jgi:hypothetical protein